ncbi:MAG: FAD-binding oxidoreductase, partial [Myxococcota bacterium]
GIARGLGRSYGDPALTDSGLVISMTGLDAFAAFDPKTGLLSCEAGVTLAQIIETFAPRGWFPPVTPGTKFVTLGGCIANDIHGKAHRSAGCFSTCVRSISVLLADGRTVEASRDERADLFWACFGGMGLLGVIVSATIQLVPIETTFFHQQAIVVRNLDELLDAFERTAGEPYSVAWIDSLATGADLGRGVLTVGSHAPLDALPKRHRRNPRATTPPSKLTVPFELPGWALNQATIRLLNVALDQMQSRAGAIAHYEKFFFPLDFVGEWNRGYGKRGFTQYQLVVPLAGGAARMREILETIVTSGQAPFLNVLKKFGPENPDTQLSFPMEGYTFAIDFPVRDGLAELLRRLDALVLDAGGRVYLGKDAFLDATTFEQMYPKLDAWREVKRTYDPDGVFHSLLSERVGLTHRGAG